jgi:hypothetical protein
MGDRVNIGFRSGDNIVFLYSHWGGSTVQIEIKNALEKAKPRWSDPGYATRIAISSIVGTQWESETGFGIYVNQICDPNQHTYVIDWLERRVEVYTSEEYERIAQKNFDVQFSFARFIEPDYFPALEEAELEDPRVMEYER